MTIIDPKIAYLTTVPGKACSFRSHYTKEYRDKIRKAARKVIKDRVLLQGKSLSPGFQPNTKGVTLINLEIPRFTII